MKYAYMIRSCIGESIGTEPAHVFGYEAAQDRPGGQRGLPKSDEARVPARKLFPAVASGDKAAILSSLEGMGVLALCPTPEQHFSGMERIVGRVIGRAKLVFLVELSLFAAELGDYERATKYASEAHNFQPVAWQLYSLSMIEGLAALNVGKKDEAIKYLRKSIDACFTDVSSCVACGTGEPNFLLAKKLLERGERVEVLRHLVDCNFVWRMLGSHIEAWIRVIENGGMPDFTVIGTWRLAVQCRSAHFLASGRDLAGAPMHRDQVIAEVERMRVEYELPKKAWLLLSAKLKERFNKWPGVD